MKYAMKRNASKRKLQGDGLKLATLLYGPPKPKKAQQELPFGKTPEGASEGNVEKDIQ